MRVDSSLYGKSTQKPEADTDRIEHAMNSWQMRIHSQGAARSEILQTVGMSQQGLNDWFSPQTLLYPRATVNSMQVEKSRFCDIQSIKSPAQRRNFSYGLQLRETADARSLANHQRYLRIWDKHSDRMGKHFKFKKDVADGKSFDLVQL